MKKFLLFITTCCIFYFPNISQANQYSEEDKQLFYNAFIDGYIAEMQKVVNSLDVEEAKKEQFMQSLKKDIDREYLIKTSWNCIEQFPVEKIVQASILCTSEWNKKQSEKNKKRFAELKQ